VHLVEIELQISLLQQVPELRLIPTATDEVEKR
jgi:hypothetical protein